MWSSDVCISGLTKTTTSELQLKIRFARLRPASRIARVGGPTATSIRKPLPPRCHLSRHLPAVLPPPTMDLHYSGTHAALGTPDTIHRAAIRRGISGYTNSMACILLSGTYTASVTLVRSYPARLPDFSRRSRAEQSRAREWHLYTWPMIYR